MKTTLLAAALATAALLSLSQNATAAKQADELVRPQHVAEAARQPANAAVLLAARRYATFWNTGDERYARLALDPGFTDRTLPPGREQGLPGPLQASKGFRTAVPDLSAQMEDVVIAGDRAAVHLRFRGHFTGQFGNAKGQGQAIDFQAFDLYRVAGGKIVENWHLEDNLTLLKQMGVNQ
ncbi:ester cyclase [Cupriavidus sp. 2TAF22]|uniref:ester cyclase n=1 Tax=unclassified Cupriavidus TaxID=2640874 RepID=UPI003F91F138